jgi:O-antigen ligase
MSITGFLSSIWLLSLPFHEFALIGTLSVDNILAPILLVFIVLSIVTQARRMPGEQTANLMWVAAAMLAYFLSHTVNLLLTEHVIWSSMYSVAKSMLYFLLPVLFIRNERDLQRSSDMMIIVTVVGCVTALMSALGLVSFEFARQAESRIDLAYIPKSVGLFSAYGDMAMLISLSLLLVIAGRKKSVLFGKGSLLKILIVLVIALIGIVSMQSRNVVFTLITSLIAFYVIGRWRKGRKWKFKLYASLAAGVVGVAITIVLFSGPLISWVEGLGGTSEAKATVEARLESYAFAWSMVSDRILLGADPQTVEQNALFISFIHNMWLKELVQSGVVGIIAVLFIFIRSLRRQVERLAADRDSNARAYLALLAGMLVATQFFPGNTPVFWVLIGIASAMPSRVLEKRIEESAVHKPAQVRNVLATSRLAK